ncbi:MAG: CotH kinase family protein [Firmicutes bacterium]|nr:CotH kinase family protein [Bacillota bacterium]
MQKSKWCMLLGLLLVLAGGIAFSFLDTGGSRQRVQQHLVSASEEELPADETGSVVPDELLEAEPAAFNQAAADYLGDKLTTHLPILVLTTSGETIPGKPLVENGIHTGFISGDQGQSEIVASYRIIDQEGSWHHVGDAASEEGSCLFRIRGNSSRWFDKSSYRMRLVDGMAPGDLVTQDMDVQTIKKSLMGMEKGDEWALYGPFLDKTLIRNYMWMNLSGLIMPGWTPNVRFCEVILDGSYQGVYVLMEMIDVSADRLNLEKYSEGDLATSYVVRIEPNISYEKYIHNFTFYTYRMEPGRKMELIYPGLKYQNDTVKQYVQTDFSQVERMVFESTSVGTQGVFSSPAWKSQVDLDSFVDYYIIEEFLGVNDVFSASTYFYRNVRGKLAIGPVWDFNNSLDNFFTPLPEEGFMLSQRGWFGQLLKDEAFAKKVIRRYRQLRSGILSDENLLAYIQETEGYLGSSIDRNYAVWGYSFNTDNLDYRQYKSPEQGSDTHLEALNPDSYEEANEWMVEYMLARAAWLDDNIDSLLQYSHPSKNQ